MKYLQNLVSGYKEFINKETTAGEYNYADLSGGQSPEVMVISCSDSRVIPSQIFNKDPGELFMVRNVANLVPPFEADEAHHGTSSALEFAVLGLKVKHIVVMGHSSCGGIGACLHYDETAPDRIFINKWLSILKETTEKVLASHSTATDAEKKKALELEAIKTSLSNLKTFPFIEEKIASGELEIHGAYFDIEDGQLYGLDGNNFEKVS